MNKTQTNTKTNTNDNAKTRIRYKKSLHQQKLDEISNSSHIMYSKNFGYVIDLYSVTIRRNLVDFKYRDVVYLHTNKGCFFIYLDTITNNGFISRIFDYPSTRNLNIKILINQISNITNLNYEIEIIE